MSLATMKNNLLCSSECWITILFTDEKNCRGYRDLVLLVRTKNTTDKECVPRGVLGRLTTASKLINAKLFFMLPIFTFLFLTST